MEYIINMNTEIERKFAIEDIDIIKQNLKKLNAIFKGSKRNIDTYFVVPQDVKSTKYLRIRIKENNSNGEFAYHEVISDLETREWETGISDVIIAKEILDKLGFEVDVIIDKYRETYEVEGCEVVLDLVKDLGSFIEIEASSEKQLQELAKKLCVEQSRVISGAGYPDLLKKKYEKK